MSPTNHFFSSNRARSAQNVSDAVTYEIKHKTFARYF